MNPDALIIEQSRANVEERPLIGRQYLMGHLGEHVREYGIGIGLRQLAQINCLYLVSRNVLQNSLSSVRQHYRAKHVVAINQKLKCVIETAQIEILSVDLVINVA